MQIKFYLNSLFQDLAENGIKVSLSLNDAEKGILEKASNLAQGGFEKKTATGQVDSIFSHLIFPRNEEDKSKEKTGLKKSFPQKTLSLDATFFPGLTDVEGDMKKKFQDEIGQLTNFEDDLVHAETLLFLFQKYGTTLPSGVAPDISLYDFAKSKAAFAQCLAAFPDLGNLPAKPFLLVGGDMSGIQDFIYDIVSTNASKNLKGRSYYLHLLGDTILTCLLDKLDLPQANVVYASGGSFFVLAPNTDAVKNALDNFEKAVSQKLFTEHKTLLSFIIDWVEFAEKQVVERKIGEAWKALNKGFERKKRAKFNRQLADFDGLFQPFEVGGELRRDVVTSEEILDSEMGKTYKLEDSFPEKVSQEEWDERSVDFIRKETAEQIFMGLFLKSTMFRMNGGADFSLKMKDWVDEHREFLPGSLDLKQYILDTDKAEFSLNSGQPRQTLAINDLDFMAIDKKSGIRGGVKGFELYGGNTYPTIPLFKRNGEKYDAAKTFSELAGMEDDDRQDQYVSDFKEAKFKRLGILRMDVDNLGKIFEEAYQNTGTLAHYSALSRQLDWFFKGYLNTLWEKGETNGQKWSEHTQIIYSGGDDLFIVGKWDCLIDFAEKIRNEFRKWTCEHDGLGISGGIVLVTPKFPVIKAAEMCEKAEKNAKNHRILVSQKNAFSLFDCPLNWEHEWPQVKTLKDDFVKMVRAGKIPKSLLMMLAAYHELKKDQIKRGESPTWRWQIAYNLTRQKQRVRENDAFEFIEKLATHILVSGELGKPRMTKYEYFDLVAIAVRWAEYDLRRDDDQTDKN